MPRVFLLVLMLLPAWPAPAQKLVFAPLAKETIEARLKTFKQDNREREAVLRELFTEAGCGPGTLREIPVKHEKAPNVLCILPGSTDSLIVVGAHFDHVSEGDGVVDNWSGASLLPSLLQSTAIEPRKHTYIFIGFTGEEDGLVGSEAYAESLTKEERAKIKAMVDIDSIGLSFTRVWVTRSDKNLTMELARMSQLLKLSVAEEDADQLVGSAAPPPPLRPGRMPRVRRGPAADSFSFESYKIPVLMIHSLTRETLPVLHSSKDTLSAIHLDDYYDTYKLLVGYLADLDVKLQ